MAMLRLLTVLLLLGTFSTIAGFSQRGVIGAGDGVPAEPKPAQSKGPLAELPSQPGAHLEKIKALGDNQWLNLGAPAADPKWGKARGRSWSANQPAAPNLRGGFVFAEGVHAYVKPDGHYMNDLWFYDINAHRWICVYPGIEVKTIVRQIKDKELVVNDAGLLVDREGQPLPPLLIHAYGYLGYDPERRKFLTFGSQFGNYFTTGKGGVFEEANQLFQEQRKGKKLPSLSPFFYDVATGKFECYPVETAPVGQPYGANVLAYVSSKKQFFYGGNDGVWYLDQEKRTWVPAKPKGVPPTGIDHCAAYDAQRDRIYYYCRDGKQPANNFLSYDVKENVWNQVGAKGPAPLAATAYESIYNFDAANDRLVVIRLHDKDEPGLRRGVYAYDPATNSWAEPLPLPPEVVKGIRNGSYGFHDPELNVYFCHFAGDSSDDGSMWVYRYRSPKK
jgi:hypothetical protein